MLDRISQVLADFLTGFQRNPSDTEEATEFHKQLFSALYRQFTAVGVKVELEKSNLNIQYYPERSQIRLNPVRTAYPPKEKFDVVVLDTNAEVTPVGEGEQNYQLYWQQPPAFVVNLHLCTEEDLLPKYLKAQQKDLRKMGAFQESLDNGTAFCGLSLLLVSTFVEDAPGPVTEWELKSGLQAWVVSPEESYLHTV